MSDHSFFALFQVSVPLLFVSQSWGYKRRRRRRRRMGTRRRQMKWLGRWRKRRRKKERLRRRERRDLKWLEQHQLLPQ